MNELKEKLAALGLDDAMTDQVIATVAEFGKSKVPASFHGMIDDVLAGDSHSASGFLGSISSLFGGR